MYSRAGRPSSANAIQIHLSPALPSYELGQTIAFHLHSTGEGHLESPSPSSLPAYPTISVRRLAHPVSSISASPPRRYRQQERLYSMHEHYSSWHANARIGGRCWWNRHDMCFQRPHHENSGRSRPQACSREEQVMMPMQRASSFFVSVVSDFGLAVAKSSS